MSGATGGTSSPFHFNSVEMREAEQAFRHAYPAFESTSSLDALRAREYARLDTFPGESDLPPRLHC